MHNFPWRGCSLLTKQYRYIYIYIGYYLGSRAYINMLETAHRKQTTLTWPAYILNTGTVSKCHITTLLGLVSLTFNVSTTVHSVLLHKAHQLKRMKLWIPLAEQLGPQMPEGFHWILCWIWARVYNYAIQKFECIVKNMYTYI